MTDPAVAEVMEYRLAARRIIRGTGDNKLKALAIVKLGEQARKASLPDWCRQAVWIEAAHFLRTGQIPEAPPSSDPVSRACRSLLAEGRSCCPSCRRPLPESATLDRWDAIATAALIEFATFERAAP